MFLILIFFSLSTFANAQFNCDATYDEMKIPHVTTQSNEAYYYCFGFHHGRDRAWQMDYFRRVGQGRNAEIYGFSSLKSDLMMKLLDLPTLAARIWKDFPEEQKKFLHLYSSGVNQGFILGKEAKEFQNLNYLPEEWRPEHSILVLLLQSFDQTRKTFTQDYLEEKYQEAWKEKAAILFDEDNMPWESTILKKGEYSERINKNSFNWKPSIPLKLWSHFPTVFGEESGSNNWAVSKEKSKSGYAIFANDPHLDLKTPLFWYWIHLTSPEYQVIGASLPGVPVVASGTNGKVAWGLTNAYINTADAVFIKNPSSDLINSFWPTVKIKFGPFQIPFFFKKFERTRFGHPVLPLELESDKKIALKWTGYSLEAKDILPMFRIPAVDNVDGMEKLLQKVGLPAWNFVFADTHGDIGHRVVGKVYKHEEKTEYGITEVSEQELVKEELLEPSERPHILRPERNYIYSANNRHWPSDSKFYGGRGYSMSFRGFRIDELLQGSQSVESFKKIQCDRQVVDARFFIKKILQYVKVPEFQQWNFYADPNSVTPSLYRRYMDLIMEKWNVNEYALFKILDNLNSAQIADLKNVLEKARKDVGNKTWSIFHRLSFPHLSKEEQWNFSPTMSGVGDKHSVDPGTANWDSEKEIYQQYSGASMRMIIEMREKPVIYLTMPGLNRNYSQSESSKAWENWRECQYSQINY